MKFRKKPIVIDAVQWYPGKEIEGVRFNDYPTPALPAGPYVMTLEGPLHVSPGDWIITGVNGEKYPCKPDVFAASYDPVTEEEV